MKVSTGYKEDHGSCAPCGVEAKDDKKKENPTYYPSVRLQGEAAEKLLSELKVGQTLDVTFTVKVTLAQQRSESSQPWADKAGASVELEIHEVEIKSDKEGDAIKSAAAGLASM